MNVDIAAFFENSGLRRDAEKRFARPLKIPDPAKRRESTTKTDGFFSGLSVSIMPGPMAAPSSSHFLSGK